MNNPSNNVKNDARSTTKSASRKSNKKKLRRSNRRRLTHTKRTAESKINFLYNSDTCHIKESNSNDYDILYTKRIKSRTRPVISFIKETKQPYGSYLVKRINITEPEDEIKFNIELNVYKLMNVLLENKITPHTFINKSSHICNRASDHNKFGFITNETISTENFDKFHFQEFIAKYGNEENFYYAFTNILFQIMYTLKCFSMIKLQHNDLHTGNIFVFVKKTHNIFNRDFFPQKKTKYIFDEQSFEMTEIGLYVFIFDFDGANKTMDAETRTSIPELNVEILQENKNIFDKIVISRKWNPYLDIFRFIKVLYTDINNLMKKYEPIYNDNDSIKCCLRIDMELDAYISVRDYEKTYGIIRDAQNVDEFLYLRLRYMMTNCIYIKIPDIPDLDDSFQQKYSENIDELIIEEGGALNLLTSRKIDRLNLVQERIGKLNDVLRYGYLSKNDDTYEPPAYVLMNASEALNVIVAELTQLQTKFEFRPFKKTMKKTELIQSNDIYNTNNLYISPSKKSRNNLKDKSVPGNNLNTEPTSPEQSGFKWYNRGTESTPIGVPAIMVEGPTPVGVPTIMVEGPTPVGVPKIMVEGPTPEKKSRSTPIGVPTIMVEGPTPEKKSRSTPVGVPTIMVEGPTPEKKSRSTLVKSKSQRKSQSAGLESPIHQSEPFKNLPFLN
jgi:hypothetical protein